MTKCNQENMAIPQKGSRAIQVDGIQYRWHIRHKPTYAQALAESPLSFSVELAENPGGKLVVTMPQFRPDSWFNDLNPELGLPVLPSHVEKSIRQALNLGWQPSSPGSPFKIHFSSSDEN